MSPPQHLLVPASAADAGVSGLIGLRDPDGGVPVYAQPRRSFLWYLVLLLLVLFIVKYPVEAGHMARACGGVLADTLAKLARSI